jgi:3-hydroxyisobutyrate dehydrogenase-like beta-hydroxyacid dehydrogenase
MRIAMHGAGHMGAGLGWALREGGADVVTTLAGRSPRTARLVEAAGLDLVEDLDTLCRTADIVLVVTPPGAARDAARALAEASGRTGARPLVADLNAIAPSTVDDVCAILAAAGLDLVDGSISGPPPTVRPGARLYFSGPRSAEVAGLPWRHVKPIDLGDRLGAASALKMSTASVYKGVVALYAQAMRAADHYGVADAAHADLAGAGYDLTRDVAVAATKAHRYVPEMREIARAQAGAGLTGALFDAFAEVWADIAAAPLADGDPESVPPAPTLADITRALHRR